MKEFSGFTRGIGLGGWLTNYKRMILIRKDLRQYITQENCLMCVELFEYAL
jgi:hypothetical protein